jgi:hypothetical protein
VRRSAHAAPTTTDTVTDCSSADSSVSSGGLNLDAALADAQASPASSGVRITYRLGIV